MKEAIEVAVAEDFVFAFSCASYLNLGNHQKFVNLANFYLGENLYFLAVSYCYCYFSIATATFLLLHLHTSDAFR